ncbi:DjlA [Desulfamplus magnetovallimortis]|uniref:DjlA n=1 Tax=Desulfamplus magnetovallimortis TaxID=1246637 RepID=A0A1W1HKI8_9BACT|nr:co-chaperone DjlA [Desulfamplus magnetovallimortis]SLM32994.1 DjlA [Desulfamplus magnetovallimortis]
MGWLGKMVGGTIGFALLGPIGAVAGAAFGHTFDKKDDGYISGTALRMYQRFSSEEVAQMTFFVAAFSMLAKIAKADGKVTEKEIASIEAFMAKDLHLDPQGRQSAISIFRQALKSPETFESFAMQFYRAFYNQPRIIELMLDILLRVSTADGDLSNAQENLILSAVKIFNVSESDYTLIKSRYVKQTDKAYAVLNCQPGVSNEVLKKQYRKLVSEYHPDKIQAKGLPDEFVKFANDKFIEIQEAYNTIRSERNIS